MLHQLLDLLLVVNMHVDLHLADQPIDLNFVLDVSPDMGRLHVRVSFLRREHLVHILLGQHHMLHQSYSTHALCGLLGRETSLGFSHLFLLFSEAVVMLQWSLVSFRRVKDHVQLLVLVPQLRLFRELVPLLFLPLEIGVGGGRLRLEQRSSFVLVAVVRVIAQVRNINLAHALVCLKVIWLNSLRHFV